MRSHPFLWTLIIIIVFVVVVAIAGYIYVGSGSYNIAATSPHRAFTLFMIDKMTDASIEKHSQGIQVPVQAGLEDTLKGFPHYNDMCIDCHGAPGIGRTEFGEGLYPKGPSLAAHESDLSPAEMFWIVKNGIKMTGMPAFAPTHSDEQIWNIVAFVRYLPHISYNDYLNIQDTLSSEMPEDMHGGEEEHEHSHD
jgi:cytochrome c